MIVPLSKRISLLVKLGEYINNSECEEWQQIKEKATIHNSWFIPEFVNVATETISTQFLQKEQLTAWISPYNLPETMAHPKKLGIVMAGNIPAVGFHDFLCGFLSGHQLVLKLSSKDKVLITHFIEKLIEWEPAVKDQIKIADMLKGCDAYIATGSNNSSRYFEQYFGKYPHIIRKNRTAVAILDGNETEEELRLLSDDMLMYFGRGCRNITKVFVPKDYDFIPLLEAMKRYDYFKDIHHYKNNFDYQLSLLLLNKAYYMTNDLVLLHQHKAPFSAMSVLHYDFYQDKEALEKELSTNDNIQCIVGQGNIPFGEAQKPKLTEYADGVDTLSFLSAL